jgi:hypothetical protein
MRLAGFLLALFLFSDLIAQIPAIGQWRDHLPYSSSNDVVHAGTKVYCSNTAAVFYVDLEDNSLNKLSKVNGLAETGINVMGFDPSTSILVIGYNSGNVDLIHTQSNEITNLSDIKRSNIVGDKSIYGVYCVNGKSYLSTGFGIVQLDLTRKEVKETYYLAAGGASVKVNGITIMSDTIFAATEKGIFRAWANHPFLADYNNWTQDLAFPSTVVNKDFSNIADFNGQVFAVYDSPLFERDTTYRYSPGSGWTEFVFPAGRDVQGISVTADRIIFAMNYNVFAFDLTLAPVMNIFAYVNGGPQPAHAVFGNNYYWIADKAKGLVRAIDPWSNTSIYPGGPYSTGAWQIAVSEGDLWIAPGTVFGSAWLNSYNGDLVSGRNDETWYTKENITNTSGLGIDSLFDIVTIAIDPNNENHVYAGSMSFDGVIEILDNQIVGVFDETNSSLLPWSSRPGYCGIAQVTFDTDGNLWVLNTFVSQPVSMRATDGSWTRFVMPSYMQGIVYKDFIIGRETGYKWVALPTGSATGGLFVWDDKGTFTDQADDEYFLYSTGAGSGNLPSADVLSIAEDLDGEIWVGTSTGIAVIYTQESVFSGGNFDAQQILIYQDGNYQHLLETEAITSIAVDGANRKWIGTDGSGVYLMSEDGTEQLYHFTRENSPLLSNQIYDIAIDHLTGEVYFATFDGIVSFRGTATIEKQPFETAYAFPNPVQSGYEGPIAIKGLDRDSEVRITDIAGNLVYATKSEGGQAIWYGMNLKGERVATGIYTVLCNSESGKSTIVAKILFIN